MSLVPPTVAQLSDFTGRPESEYSSYAVQALAQASLLMQYATGLDAWPDGDYESQMMLNGILDAADGIYLAQQYKKVNANPFSSESIGSYSYSKMSSAIQRGEATGLTWFDMAVSELGVKHGFEASKGVSVFERDDLAVDAVTGNVFVAGPSNSNKQVFPFDVSQNPPWGD